jgi:purine nucleosidase
MKVFFPILITITLFSCNNKPAPVSIIFDTDIAPDYDDVGAQAILHAFAGNIAADRITYLIAKQKPEEISK